MNYADLWTHDDESGRQRWKLTYVYGEANRFNLEIVEGRPGCETNMLSAHDGYGAALVTQDDLSGAQQFTINGF